MLKQIIIISIFLSFCFGQETAKFSNLRTIIKSVEDTNTNIKDLIESYETKIDDLADRITKTEKNKKQLEAEMEIQQKFSKELDSLKVSFEEQLSELIEKHRDVTNFRDEMEVELSKEPKGSLEEEKGE